ncbi:MAG: hypothetical protein ACJ8GN_25140 [Longimicrobiaceae bacterium]
MTDTAAPPALAFRRRSTLERLVLDPDLEIGAGGEAVVYGVPGDGSLVAKVYHHPTIERARKLAAMLDHPPALPEGTATAWPVDLLLDGGGRFAGFVMPRAEGPRLFEFYNPVSRRGAAPGFHAGLLHRAGRNLAAAFDALHAAGYVVGDVNESNLLVSPADAALTLVDADSLQVRDAETGTVHRSKVGKAEFTPPELQGVSFETVDRVEAHDRFGLAVLLYLVLMEGTHPFATRLDADGEAKPVEERIRRGLFPHASAVDDCHPPRLAPRFHTLHPPLQALFLRAFVEGHADPAARPSPAEWRDALDEAEAALAVCAANSLHRHPPHLAACPWCGRTALLGGRDPFPPAGTAVARAPRPPRPRPRRVPAPPPAASPAPAAPSPGAAPGDALSLDDVFSPAGLGHPLVWLVGAVTLALLGGILSVVAGIAALIAVVALVRTRGRHFSAVTVQVAVWVALSVFMAAMVMSAVNYPEQPPYPEQAPPASSVGVRPPVDPALQPLADPLAVRDVAPFMVPDLRAASVTNTAEQMPEPVYPYDAGFSDVDVRLLDRAPRLVNEADAARALAISYARNGGWAEPKADTALVWLRVEPNGGVVYSQVISSTSDPMDAAAGTTVNYLRYEPGMKDGVAYPTWVVQRFVIVP